MKDNKTSTELLGFSWRFIDNARNRKHLFVLQPDQDDSDSEDGIFHFSWIHGKIMVTLFLLTPSVAIKAVIYRQIYITKLCRNFWMSMCSCAVCTCGYSILIALEC